MYTVALGPNVRTELGTGCGWARHTMMFPKLAISIMQRFVIDLHGC